MQLFSGRAPGPVKHKPTFQNISVLIYQNNPEYEFMLSATMLKNCIYESGDLNR